MWLFAWHAVLVLAFEITRNRPLWSVIGELWSVKQYSLLAHLLRVLYLLFFVSCNDLLGGVILFYRLLCFLVLRFSLGFVVELVIITLVLVEAFIILFLVIIERFLRLWIYLKVFLVVAVVLFPWCPALIQFDSRFIYFLSWGGLSF